MGVLETGIVRASELFGFFPVLILLLLSAHLFGGIFSLLKLPRAIGEIFGGFVLGPTVLGFFYPGLHQWLTVSFAKGQDLPAFFYWLGLILLMCISGFEVQRSFDREDRKIITALLLGATLIPFSAGFFLPWAVGNAPFAGQVNSPLALQIILGVAVAITSIPVIAKIFIDLGVISTRFAKIVLTTAVFHDIILWVALAAATGLVSSGGPSFFSIGRTAVITVVFLACAVSVFPRILACCNKSKFNSLISFSAPLYILVICSVFVLMARIARVNTIFGAFTAGICIGSTSEERFEKAKASIGKIALRFFIPLYFAIVGLRIDLIRYFDARLFLFFLVYATVSAVSGTMLAARLAGRKWRSSLNFAVAMNARGILGVVLASEALNFGIINETFFAVLVLVSIFTTVGAGFWFRCVLPRSRELQHA